MLLALGVASLFNHSDEPNLDYRIDKTRKIITFVAARDIKASEELTFYYGSKLWFEDSTKQYDVARQTPMHSHIDDEHQFFTALTL